MGFLEDLQASATDILGAATDKAVEQIQGQQTPLPQNVVAPISSTPVSSVDSSTMTMILGALAIGAIAFFAVKKVKA